MGIPEIFIFLKKKHKNMQKSLPTNRSVRLIKSFSQLAERYIIKILILLMSLLLVLATIELVYHAVKSFVEAESLLIDLSELQELFGIFLLVLIGIELLDTIKVYFKSNVVHVEVVILVAIIAVARKVVVLDFDKFKGLELIGLAFLVIALAVSYYLIKKAGSYMVCKRDDDDEKHRGEDVTPKMP